MASLIVKVGSKNPAKVAAVTELLRDYPKFAEVEIISEDTPSGVGDQPRSLEEVTIGATNRAKNAFSECDYSVGIESGFMEVPHSKSGYMNVCAAAIYNGKEMALGLSTAFETPDSEMMRLVMEENMSFDQAAHSIGFTQDEHIGKSDGIIGILTNGKVDRKEYTKEALRTALIHIDKPQN